MKFGLTALIDLVRYRWCCLWHNAPTLPIHNRYQCRLCHVWHPAHWDDRHA